jgi:hypothetical protein
MPTEQALSSQRSYSTSSGAYVPPVLTHPVTAVVVVFDHLKRTSSNFYRILNTPLSLHSSHHSYTHTPSHAHILPLTHTSSHTHSLSLSLTHTHTHSLSLSHTHNRSWRVHFSRTVAMKFNCFFLMPFLDDFPTYLVSHGHGHADRWTHNTLSPIYFRLFFCLSVIHCTLFFEDSATIYPIIALSLLLLSLFYSLLHLPSFSLSLLLYCHILTPPFLPSFSLPHAILSFSFPPLPPSPSISPPPSPPSFSLPPSARPVGCDVQLGHGRHVRHIRGQNSATGEEAGADGRVRCKLQAAETVRTIQYGTVL